MLVLGRSQLHFPASICDWLLLDVASEDQVVGCTGGKNQEYVIDSAHIAIVKALSLRLLP